MKRHAVYRVIHADIGDRIVIRPKTEGRPVRSGEIVDARGREGTPPFVVRWDDSGRLALYFPGADAHVRHVHGAH
jgi:hypothetical protein